MNRKLFCVLEQGKYVNETLTIEHKKMFNTEFSDFYRLNWYTEEDDNADFFAHNITLSEGKNILYQKVPKIYDYYIFIDDDVIFESLDKNKVSEKIRELLLKYKPLHGTFYRRESNKWGAWHISEVLKIHPIHKRGAWPICGYDLDCDIYHYSYIKQIFPIKYHGCYKCLGYSQYICYKLYPGKQIMMDGIRIINTRKSNHKEELSLSQANSGLYITKLFLGDLLKNDLNKNAHIVLNNEHMIPHINRQIYPNYVDSKEIIFTREDMEKICIT